MAKGIIGRRVRITIDEDGEVVDSRHCGHIDGSVTATLRGRGEAGSTLWLVETEDKVLLAREEIRQKIGREIRRVIIQSSRDDISLEEILDGYWVSIALFAVPDNEVIKIGKPLDLANSSLEFLQTQMAYIAPSELDPYLGRWKDGRVYGFKKIPPRSYGSQTLRNVFEIEIRLEKGHKYVGFTSDRFLAERPASSVICMGLSLVNCARISRSGATRKSYIKALAGDSYLYEAEGVIIGRWWPTERWYSIDIGGLVVVVQDSLETLDMTNPPRMGDFLHVVGELQISQDSPYNGQEV